MHISS